MNEVANSNPLHFEVVRKLGFFELLVDSEHELGEEEVPQESQLSTSPLAPLNNGSENVGVGGAASDAVVGKGKENERHENDGRDHR